MRGHMGQVSRQYKAYRFKYERVNFITGLPYTTDEVLYARTQAEAERKAKKVADKHAATLVGDVYCIED